VLGLAGCGIRKKAASLIVSLAFGLAACSGASSGSGPLPAAGTVGPSGSAAPHHRKGRLVLQIHIPKRKHHRRVRVTGARGPHYISPATQSMTIALTGPTDLNESVGLTPNSQGCSSSLAGTLCTLTIGGLAPGAYTGSISTFDGPLVGGSASGAPLSANQNVGFSIVAGQSNSIGVVMGGIPNSVLLLSDASVLSGNTAGGYSLSRCTSAAQHVTVVGVDADGNYIVGAGAPTPTLTSDDTLHLTVATPAPSAPNRFTLMPPDPQTSSTLPSPNQVLHLTASVTPSSDSGGTQQSAVVNVTFTGGSSVVCGVITEYTLPTSNSQPFHITSGPDGNVWFTEYNGGNIGKITTTGTITEYPTPTSSSQPAGITTGPDNNLWFTEQCGNKIGTMTTAGVATEFSSRGSGDLNGITTGPDGNLWFTAFAQIGQITTAGSLDQFTVPVPVENQSMLGILGGIVTGPDGNLWFTESENNKIGTITTAGVITAYALASNGSDPTGIVAGPDGNLWFTECGNGKIGKITTTGSVTEYSLSSRDAEPQGITAGPDGALWFTEYLGNGIGRITTAGAITEYPLPNNSLPQDITLGPDGKLWFTESCTNKIASME
jgi:streptogramin lyase